MRIVIATPLYPPEIGGPSYYAGGLEASLRRLGHDVEIVTYGNLRTWPMGISHLAYFFRIWPALRVANVVIALDTASVAIPAWFASRIRGVPFIIRTGGDFVWEHYLEHTHNLVPLKYFYDEVRNLSAKEHLVFVLTRLIARRSLMVFSTQMQRDVWLHPYGLKKEETHIIGNAVDEPLASVAPTKKNFLWHVRPIAMKNGAHVHAAFSKAAQTYPDISLEEGTMPKAELLGRMKDCYAIILPSVTEISPNYILDALRFKKPFIMDKYSGFADWLGPYGTLVDPLDEDDIARAIGALASPEGYAEAVKKAAAFSFVRTYDDVARDFLALIDNEHYART
jgi:glycosyltransferase involved in cell wall biosynthesis